MYKVFVVANREFQSQVKSKAFIISLILMPVLMVASIGIQKMAGDSVDIKDRKIVLIDRTEKLAKKIETAVNQRNQNTTRDKDGKQIKPEFHLEIVKPSDNPTEQGFELSNRVRNKELNGFVELSEGIIDPANGKRAATIRYFSNSPTDREFPRWLDATINRIVQTDRFEKANLPRAEVLKAMKKIPLDDLGLLSKNDQGEIVEAEKTNRAVAFILPFGLMMILFMGVMVGSTPLLQAIIEEKMQRIAEVLLGSVSPFQLMLGKILGVTAVSMSMIGLYLGGGIYVLHYFDMSDMIAPGQIAWLLAFAALSIFMFGSIFCAIGASCSEIKDAQSLMTPVMIILMLPMFFLSVIIRAPSGTLATVLSFIPPATPTIMILRMNIPPGIPLWQPIVGIFGVLAFTAFSVYAASRVFRVGILMQGKPPKLTEMLGWVFRG